MDFGENRSLYTDKRRKRRAKKQKYTHKINKWLHTKRAFVRICQYSPFLIGLSFIDCLSLISIVQNKSGSHQQATISIVQHDALHNDTNQLH